MNDASGSDPPQGPERPLTLEDFLQELDVSGWPRRLKRILVVVAILLLLIGLNWARSFYTDWLWFSNLGYQQVLLKMVSTKIWLFLAGGLLFAAIAATNLYLVFRTTRGQAPLAQTGISPHRYAAVRQLLSWLSVGTVALISLFVAAGVARQWDSILRFLSAVPFDRLDPIFQKDLSFFVFTLPVLHFIQKWLLEALIVVTLMVAVLYYLFSRLRGEVFTFSGRVQAHLAGLGTTIFLLLALGHWLGRYDLLYSTSGAVVGVGYTEANAGIPVHYLMTGVAILSGILLSVGAFSSGRRLTYWAIGLWFGLNIVAGSVLPALIQRFYVEPSEFAREEPYLANHIQLTRQAYALDQLQSQSHPAKGTVEADTVAQNQGTVQNIRLWDEDPLLQSYNQIQFFRLYYDFLSVTTDRYVIDGQLRQVMLSTREISAEKLPQEAQRWVNRYLQFTHGYGVAMSPVTEVESGGRAAFFLKDVPPQGKISLERAEIYYGLKSLDSIIVRTRMQEINYPGRDGPVYTRYEGQGGVLLSSLFRRLLYAWQFRDLNILISGEIEPQSRIQYRRTVPQRFSTLTPFLLRDQNPYVVVADGRLFWIQDAYTVTNRYPYSTAWQGQFNYIRNSVKAVIDAYHGTVDFYIADPTDPLVQTYQRIFPGLFKPLEEMPGYLQPHLRYPLDFFTIQVQMLLQYHMQDPGVFYNKEDQWALPLQTSFGGTSTLEPYYIVARLPDEDREEFLLIQPFTPVDRHNLVAWIAARNDALHYGELVLFHFPSGRHVDGPNQVEARIDNDAIISEQFTLWGQVGSEVARGILLVIPLGDSILYAEPVFLRPEALEFPELRRIILADATKVVMHATLERSVRALVGELPTVAPTGGDEVEEQVATVLEERAPPPFRSQELEAIKVGLQEALEKLREVLDRLQRATPR
ncbi:UPF0182 family protein [Acidobacteria bacterium AH-259-O06]|nr:UPF0182 family protein [Acidobacteria bacterium AH-259-O06]